MSFKGKLAVSLQPELRTEPGLSLVNKIIVFLILASAFVAIIETEPYIADHIPTQLMWLELFFFIIFSVEYCARVYASDYPSPTGNVQTKVQYIFTFWALLDLAVLISFVMAFGESSVFVIRLLRLMRIVRLARIGRFSPAIGLLVEALRNRSHEIFVTFTVALTFMIFSSGILYTFEAEHQPEAFGSIIRAFWWAIATLTTVGYGDVTPITIPGKIAASFTAISGVGLVAMPAGILAAAISEAIQKQKK